MIKKRDQDNGIEEKQREIKGEGKRDRVKV